MAVVDVFGYNTWADGSYSFFLGEEPLEEDGEKKKYLLSFLPHLLRDGALFVFSLLHFPYFPRRKRTKALFFCLFLEKGRETECVCPMPKMQSRMRREEGRSRIFLASVGGGKKWMEMFSPHFFSFSPDDDVPRFPLFSLSPEMHLIPKNRGGGGEKNMPQNCAIRSFSSPPPPLRK